MKNAPQGIQFVLNHQIEARQNGRMRINLKARHTHYTHIEQIKVLQQ
jgi:hypothetical protein